MGSDDQNNQRSDRSNSNGDFAHFFELCKLDTACAHFYFSSKFDRICLACMVSGTQGPSSLKVRSVASKKQTALHVNDPCNNSTFNCFFILCLFLNLMNPSCCSTKSYYWNAWIFGSSTWQKSKKLWLLDFFKTSWIYCSIQRNLDAWMSDNNFGKTCLVHHTVNNIILDWVTLFLVYASHKVWGSRLAWDPCYL